MYRFFINCLLIISGLAMILSGLIQQVAFHIGGHGVHQDAVNQLVWGLTHAQWSTAHKVVIVIFSLLMIYHTVVHWKWYKGVISKKRINKNGSVMLLSALFILVALTGLIPWFIDLSGSPTELRKILIEIHDKLALFLSIFLLLHIAGKTKWFHTALIKLRK